MNKKILTIVILIVIVAAIFVGLVLLRGRKVPSTSITPVTPTPPTNKIGVTPEEAAPVEKEPEILPGPGGLGDGLPNGEISDLLTEVTTADRVYYDERYPYEFRYPANFAAIKYVWQPGGNVYGLEILPVELKNGYLKDEIVEGGHVDWPRITVYMAYDPWENSALSYIQQGCDEQNIQEIPSNANLGSYKCLNDYRKDPGVKAAVYGHDRRIFLVFTNQFLISQHFKYHGRYLDEYTDEIYSALEQIISTFTFR